MATTSSGVASRNNRLRSRVRSARATGRPTSTTTITYRPNENGWVKVAKDRNNPPENRMASLYS